MHNIHVIHIGFDQFSNINSKEMCTIGSEQHSAVHLQMQRLLLD
jgi:hypothetical protein